MSAIFPSTCACPPPMSNTFLHRAFSSDKFSLQTSSAANCLRSFRRIRVFLQCKVVLSFPSKPSTSETGDGFSRQSYEKQQVCGKADLDSALCLLLSNKKSTPVQERCSRLSVCNCPLDFQRAASLVVSYYTSADCSSDTVSSYTKLNNIFNLTSDTKNILAPNFLPCNIASKVPSPTRCDSLGTWDG